MTCFVKAGPEFRVDARVNGTQTDPAVAALASGGFVITWTDYTYLLEELGGADVRAQIYGASGERIGGEFLINTETIDHQRDAKITGLLGGGFVVVWQDYSGRRGDECGSSIKAKVFGRGGELVRDEFLVNVETRDSQIAPVVAALSDGGFVIAWHDLSGTRGDDNVKARLFGLDGLPSSDEFVANSFTRNYQGAPSVAALVGGGYVVAWHDLAEPWAISATAASKRGRSVEMERRFERNFL